MEEWFAELAAHSPYFIIVGVLLVTGFGLPLPEDIPLIVAGYLCGTDYADIWIMLPSVFLAIIGADAMVYGLGRRYGHHVPKLPLLRRFLTEDRLARTEAMLHLHGGKFIFMARFLPGLRTAAFFTAGIFKIPYWKFLFYDGAAALISVPTIVLLAYYFANELDRVREWVAEGQLWGIGICVAVIAVLVLVKRLFKRRIAAAGGV